MQIPPAPGDPALLVAAEEVVKKRFAADFADAATPAKKAELARKLLAATPQRGDPAALRYVLLKDACAGRGRRQGRDGLHRGGAHRRHLLGQRRGPQGRRLGGDRAIHQEPQRDREVALAGVAAAEKAFSIGKLPEAGRLAKVAADAAKKADAALLLKNALAVTKRIEALKK